MSGAISFTHNKHFLLERYYSSESLKYIVSPFSFMAKSHMILGLYGINASLYLSIFKVSNIIILKLFIFKVQSHTLNHRPMVHQTKSFSTRVKSPSDYSMFLASCAKSWTSRLPMHLTRTSDWRSVARWRCSHFWPAQGLHHRRSAHKSLSARARQQRDRQRIPSQSQFADPISNWHGRVARRQIRIG